MYRYEDVGLWIKKVLPIQNTMKKYVTVRECMKAWGLYTTSAAHRRLEELVRRGLAEKIVVGKISHYHIKEEDEISE